MIKRYLKFWWIINKTHLILDTSFRLNFFIGMIGAFCYVFLYFFIIFFLTQNISFGKWTQKEMLVLLGCFYLFAYSYFFLFWRGLNRLIQNINSGQFDAFLTKPIDTQFYVSSVGGGVHNFLGAIFGIGVLIYGSLYFLESLDIIRILLVPITLFLGVIDFYSLAIVIITLNFKYGNLGEIMNFMNSFQDFMRYPTEAFSKLPLILLFIALPFSFLTTIPASLVINKNFPILEIITYIILSIAFILISRKLFYNSIKNYSSGN